MRTIARSFHTSRLERERGMRKFKSMEQVQRFLNAHAAAHYLFNLRRQLVLAKRYRFFRQRAFASWEKAVAI
jgi:transposase-like protein